MTSPLELSANAVNALSILLAARNSVHTWWTGIIGCPLFMALFYSSQLYGDSLLQRFTNAYAPFVDSAVMALSVLAQLLLMQRRYETWWFWIAVNVMSIGLFVSRDLRVTAALYCAFLVNAVVASILWRRHLKSP